MTLSERDAHALGIEAYLYLYPLVTMDVTRRQMINAEPGTVAGRGPMNTFVHLRAFPPADFRAVVRPNFDTLYSIAWLDLTTEPMIVSVPDTGDRYYLLPMMDMWTDVFASPGSRTTGTEAGHFLIATPQWQGRVPDGVERIDSPTPQVWVIGRTKTDGPADYEAVNAIQDGFGLTPLSQWGQEPVPPTVTIDPSVDMVTPPKVQVDDMSIDAFLTYGAELMRVNPPHLTDHSTVARLRRLGIVAGRPFDFGALDPAIQKALHSVPQDAQELMAWSLPRLGSVANGWSMNTDSIGVYGNFYLKRAVVAQIGLGANQPEDGFYPIHAADADGQPLDGTNAYVLHFDGLPPVDAFWSLTLYDADGFAVPNDLRRSAISSWMDLAHNADGSLDLFIQHDHPGPDKEARWLPAPAGPCNLLLRLYEPQPDALNGRWVPPPVRKA